MFLKKSPEYHEPNSVGHTVLPTGEISLPDIHLHANSHGCHQGIKRTIVHDHTAPPVFAFQARSAGERSTGRNIPLFWFIALWWPHHWSAKHLHSSRGSGGVLRTCLLPPWLSTALHSASPDKQLGNGARGSLLATSVQLGARHISPLWLNACFLFMAPSTLINIRNSLIMFFSLLNLYSLILSTHISTLRHRDLESDFFKGF